MFMHEVLYYSTYQILNINDAIFSQYSDISNIPNINAEYSNMSGDESNINISTNYDGVILNEERSLIVNIDEDKGADRE